MLEGRVMEALSFSNDRLKNAQASSNNGGMTSSLSTCCREWTSTLRWRASLSCGDLRTPPTPRQPSPCRCRANWRFRGHPDDWQLAYQLWWMCITTGCCWCVCVCGELHVHVVCCGVETCNTGLVPYMVSCSRTACTYSCIVHAIPPIYIIMLYVWTNCCLFV